MSVFRNVQDYSLGRYTSYLKNITNTILEKCDDSTESCPYITGDFTPRTAYHADDWDDESWNLGYKEPKYLTPHKIQRVLPDAKVIFMLRDPVERLFSDYRYSSLKNSNRGDFHSKVLQAIHWWGNCTTLLPERSCAYGIHYPAQVAPLGRENCPVGKTCHPKVFNWKGSSGDRLRISLYVLYIQDWLNVFKKEDILVIKFEDYVHNPQKMIIDQLLPFLGLAQNAYQESWSYNLSNIKNKNEVQFAMAQDTRILLNTFFKPYNKRLQDVLMKHSFNINLTSWTV